MRRFRAVPPISRVRLAGSAMVASMAASITAAAALKLLPESRPPSQSRSIAAEPISDDELAMSLPAMPGADPRCACASRYLRPR